LLCLAKQNADEALKAAFDITGSSRKAPKGTIYSARRFAKNRRFGENVDALISPFARLRARWNKATTYEEFDAIEKETTKLIDETLTNPLRVEGPNTVGFRTVGGGRQPGIKTVEELNPFEGREALGLGFADPKNLAKRRKFRGQSQRLDSTKPTPLKEVTPTPSKAGVGETRIDPDSLEEHFAHQSGTDKPMLDVIIEALQSLLKK